MPYTQCGASCSTPRSLGPCCTCVYTGSTLDSDQANFKEVHRRLIKREGLPVFEPVPITLDMLLAEGRRLVAEQDAVNSAKLSEEYMRGVKASKGRKMQSILGLMG